MQSPPPARPPHAARKARTPPVHPCVPPHERPRISPRGNEPIDPPTLCMYVCMRMYVNHFPATRFPFLFFLHKLIWSALRLSQLLSFRTIFNARNRSSPPAVRPPTYHFSAPSTSVKPPESLLLSLPLLVLRAAAQPLARGGEAGLWSGSGVWLGCLVPPPLLTLPNAGGVWVWFCGGGVLACRRC